MYLTVPIVLPAFVKVWFIFPDPEKVKPEIVPEIQEAVQL
jgi:hypothetical protein